MKKRTQNFLYVLLGVFVFALGVQSIQDDGRTFGSIVILAITGFALWRIIIFLRALVRPAVKAINESETGKQLKDHIDKSAEEAFGRRLK